MLTDLNLDGLVGKQAQFDKKIGRIVGYTLDTTDVRQTEIVYINVQSKIVKTPLDNIKLMSV